MQQAHEPTPETIEKCREFAAIGLPQDMIARLIGISKPTLEKYYDEHLKWGEAHGTQQVAKTLFSKAINGDVASMIFWMKARAKWSERPPEEPNDAAIHVHGGLPKPPSA